MENGARLARSSIGLFSLCLWLAACAPAKFESESVVFEIGPQGGLFDWNDVQLRVPAGALAEPTLISVVETSDADLPDWDPLSPTYRFSPAGLQFAQPVEVSIRGTALAQARVLWTDSNDDFHPLETTRDEFWYRAEIEHFSLGLVARRSEAPPDAGTTPTPDAGAEAGSPVDGLDGGEPDAAAADAG